MEYMVVTVDVSKLSGWLNADACCQKSNGGHTMRGDLQGGRRQMAGDGGARSVRGSARLQIESRECGEERTLNMCCTFVTLEVSKLSGWLNADATCRESKGEHTVWCEVQSTGRREAAGDRGASGAQGRGRLQIGSRARGGAHPERLLHGCDVGGVEAQRLVERRRALPRVERRAYDAGRAAGREAGGDGRRRCKQCAGEGPTADWGQGTGRSAPRT